MHDVPYLGVDVGEGTGGDISESLAEVQSPMRLPYVRVEDLARTLDAVRSNGGEVRKYRRGGSANLHSRLSGVSA